MSSTKRSLEILSLIWSVPCLFSPNRECCYLTGITAKYLGFPSSCQTISYLSEAVEKYWICVAKKLFKINHENTKVRKHEKRHKKKDERPTSNIERPTSNEKRTFNGEKRWKVKGTDCLYQIFSATNDHEFTRIYEKYSI